MTGPVRRTNVRAVGVAALVALASGAGLAAAAPPDDGSTELLRRFEALNGACRGGRGDDPETIEACAGRDAVFRDLAWAGWCFGRDGEVEARREWRRCDAASRTDAAGPALPADADLQPHEYFGKAATSWSAGRREDATFWLYVAQLRWRARLAARPDLDPSGEPALFASLMEVVGRPINEHAFGDVAEATAIIDRALAWDAANPDRSVPEDVRTRTRAGLVALRDDMRRSVDAIRRERTGNGLPNR
jgi:hypothetical protein